MKRKLWGVSAGLCVLAIAAMWAAPAAAQMSEVKEKPPLYSYVANWAIPRAQWAEMEKGNAADQKVLDQALAKGTIVGYGNDSNLIHQADGATHDNWWSAMSMAGLLDVLEQFYSNGSAVSPVLASATKHWDSMWVSRYYNWRPGSWTGYTHVSFYKLKRHAPDDAIELLSKNLIAPLLEKMLANGVINEYEIDTQAIHTGEPGEFMIVYITAGTDGVDKVNAAIRETLKANPLDGPAFGSMVDFTSHRDELLRTKATYK